MTKRLQKLVESDPRVTGYSIEPDGVFIYTDSSKWCDDHGSGTFTGETESEAIQRFKDQVRPASHATR